MNYLMSHRKIQHCARMPHFPVFQGDDRDLSSKRSLNTIKHTFTVCPEVCLERFMVTTRPMFCQGVLGSSKKNVPSGDRDRQGTKCCAWKHLFFRLQVYGSGSPFSRSFWALPRIDFLNWNTWRSFTIVNQLLIGRGEFYQLTQNCLILCDFT